jgi:hypothetical protein
MIHDLEHDMQQAIDAGIVPDFPVSLMTSAMMGASIEIFPEDIGSHSARQKAEFLGNIFLGGIQRLASVTSRSE